MMMILIEMMTDDYYDDDGGDNGDGDGDDYGPPVFDDSCVMQLLKLLHPKVNKLLKLKENYLCLEALEQLASSEEDRANLSPSMREVIALLCSLVSSLLKQILENSAELKAEHKVETLRRWRVVEGWRIRREGRRDGGRLRDGGREGWQGGREGG
eukprot:745897-Hanusia_phi.AAC.9